MADKPGTDSREWRLIEKMVGTLGQEQRRARRWGIFFKLLTFAYLFLVLALFLPGMGPSYEVVDQPHTALIEVEGVIAHDEPASADNLADGLRRAFEEKNAEAVLLRINSPGGSPVQAGYVYDEINRLKAEHEKPVYAVISDLGASGAYYIAAAADHIYADQASLVGSIGVTASGFGFVGTLDKLGIERRSYTAGEHKGFLDPFSVEDPEERRFWEGVLEVTHRQFVDRVKAGRGDRLKSEPKLFSGLIWSGEEALELGLVDGLGSAGYVAREVIGVEKIIDYTYQPDPLEGLARKLGLAAVRAYDHLLNAGEWRLY